MQYELCRHIKTNGLQCKGAALAGGIWCYFHHRLHQRHSAFRPTQATRGYLIPGQHIELTALEDRESVQVALSVVINALAIGQLTSNAPPPCSTASSSPATTPAASRPNPSPPTSSAPSNPPPMASTSPNPAPSSNSKTHRSDGKDSRMITTKTKRRKSRWCASFAVADLLKLKLRRWVRRLRLRRALPTALRVLRASWCGLRRASEPSR